MTIKETIIHALHRAAPALLELRDDFYIFGSAAMILSDVTVEHTEDIDILVSNRDAEFLKEFWHNKDLHITPKESEVFRSNLSRYKFDGIDIEIVGELEINKGDGWHPFVIYDTLTYPIGNLLIKIPTLQEQKNILHLFGRKKDMDRIKLIDERINLNNSKI